MLLPALAHKGHDLKRNPWSLNVRRSGHADLIDLASKWPCACEAVLPMSRTLDSSLLNLRVISSVSSSMVPTTLDTCVLSTQASHTM